MSIDNDVRDLINSIVDQGRGEIEHDFTRQIDTLGVDLLDFRRALIDRIIDRHRYRFRSIDPRQMQEILEQIQLHPDMQLYEVAGRVSIALRNLDRLFGGTVKGLPGDPTKEGDPM